MIPLFIYNCSTESVDDEKYNNVDIINSLYDTIISPTIHEEDPATLKGIYDLDIDNDNIADVIFMVEKHSLGRDFHRKSSIETKNDYSIAFQNSYEIITLTNDQAPPGYVEVDSAIVIAPKNLSLKDTISKELLFTKEPITVAYYEHGMYQDYEWYHYLNDWVENGEGYIGLYNETESICCWLKINVIDYDNIMLKSFKYSIGEIPLVIKEK